MYRSHRAYQVMVTHVVLGAVAGGIAGGATCFALRIVLAAAGLAGTGPAARLELFESGLRTAAVYGAVLGFLGARGPKRVYIWIPAIVLVWPMLGTWSASRQMGVAYFFKWWIVFQVVALAAAGAYQAALARFNRWSERPRAPHTKSIDQERRSRDDEKPYRLD